MLGVFAEFETSLRRKRQLEGIRAAKGKSVYKGRKPFLATEQPYRFSMPQKTGMVVARTPSRLARKALSVRNCPALM